MKTSTKAIMIGALFVSFTLANVVAAKADPIDNASAQIAAQQQAMDDEIAAVSALVKDINDNLPTEVCCYSDDTPDDQSWPVAPVFGPTDWYENTTIATANPFTF